MAKEKSVDEHASSTIRIEAKAYPIKIKNKVPSFLFELA